MSFYAALHGESGYDIVEICGNCQECLRLEITTYDGHESAHLCIKPDKELYTPIMRPNSEQYHTLCKQCVDLRKNRPPRYDKCDWCQKRLIASCSFTNSYFNFIPLDIFKLIKKYVGDGMYICPCFLGKKAFGIEYNPFYRAVGGVHLFDSEDVITTTTGCITQSNTIDIKINISAVFQHVYKDNTYFIVLINDGAEYSICKEKRSSLKVKRFRECPSIVKEINSDAYVICGNYREMGIWFDAKNKTILMSDNWDDDNSERYYKVSDSHMTYLHMCRRDGTIRYDLHSNSALMKLPDNGDYFACGGYLFRAYGKMIEIKTVDDIYKSLYRYIVRRNLYGVITQRNRILIVERHTEWFITVLYGSEVSLYEIPDCDDNIFKVLCYHAQQGTLDKLLHNGILCGDGHYCKNCSTKMNYTFLGYQLEISTKYKWMQNFSHDESL